MIWLRALFLAVLLSAPCYADDLPLLGVGTQKTAASSSTTFDPSNAGPGITFSGGNTVISTTAAEESVRTVASHSTGKYFAEFTITANNGPGSLSLGIVNASATITVSGYFLGGDANLSAGMYDNTCLFQNNACQTITGGSALTYTTADVIDFAIDVGGGLAWWRKNGGSWNNNASANPASGTGGYSFSAITGAVFLAASMGSTGTASVITGNFGASGFSFTPPVGFGNF